MNNFISLEGNIGAGKSTLLKLLNKHLFIHNKNAIKVLQEPVNEWLHLTNSDGTNILENF